MKNWTFKAIIAISGIVVGFISCNNGNNATHSHSYGNWIIKTEATCTTAKIEKRTCSCGEEETRTVGDPLGHDWNDWLETRTGVETVTCGHVGCNETNIRLTLGIGDIGPGGGIIFYRSEIGFLMTDNNSTAYYLEAALSDQGAYIAWASSEHINSAIMGMDDTGQNNTPDTVIGAGRKNTALILTTDAAAPAALVCKNYTIVSENDWFLPSRDELNQMYENLHQKGLGDFTTINNFYWTSSQHDCDTAWLQRFNDGSYAAYVYKFATWSVRAVRAF